MSADYKSYNDNDEQQKLAGFHAELEIISLLEGAGHDVTQLGSIGSRAQTMRIKGKRYAAPDIISEYDGDCFAFEVKFKRSGPTRYGDYGIPTWELDGLKASQRRIGIILVKDGTKGGAWFVWRLDLAELERHASYGNDGKQTFIPASLFQRFDPADLVPTIH